MRVTARLASIVAAGCTTAAIVLGGALATPAGASPDHPGDAFLPSVHGADHAVFVATDDVTGNHVVAYHRADDGTLTPAGSYATGGLGGSLTGAVVDRTASQGALAYDSDHGFLYAVNAGSDTVSAFVAKGDRLRLIDIVPSGGSFPVSIAIHDDLVAVLNARGGGLVRDFRSVDGHLFAIRDSSRALGLDPSAAPEFTHTPGQVAFSPDGSKLLVTTKANTSAVDVFDVRRDGRLSANPTVTTFAGDVPFAVAFDGRGHVFVSLAGTNAVATATLNHDGSLSVIESDATGQAATCWIVQAGDQLYASNAGSGTLTGFDADRRGRLSLIGNTSTDAGTVDAAATANGRFLYVQAGKAGMVDAFRVNRDGSLTALGSQLVPGAVGGEGIIAV